MSFLFRLDLLTDHELNSYVRATSEAVWPFYPLVPGARKGGWFWRWTSAHFGEARVGFPVGKSLSSTPHPGAGRARRLSRWRTAPLGPRSRSIWIKNQPARTSVSGWRLWIRPVTVWSFTYRSTLKAFRNCSHDFFAACHQAALPQRLGIHFTPGSLDGHRNAAR